MKLKSEMPDSTDTEATASIERGGPQPPAQEATGPPEPTGSQPAGQERQAPEATATERERSNDPFEAFMSGAGPATIEGELPSGVTSAPDTQEPTGSSPDAEAADSEEETGTERQAPEATGSAEEADSEGEAGTETTGSEEAAGSEEGSDERSNVAEQIAEEAGLETTDPSRIADTVRELKTEVQGFQTLQQVLESRPGFQQMVSEMADGKSAVEAAAALDGVEPTAPDPQESPEDYAEWKAAQERKQEKRRQQRQKAKRRQERIQRKQARMEEDFESVTSRYDLSDKEKAAVGDALASLTVTEPDAEFQPKHLDALVKGLRFDELEKQIRADEREKVMNQVQGDGTVEPEDTAPTLVSAGSGGDDAGRSGQPSSEAEALAAFFGVGQESEPDIHDQF
jgi:hypothetical protein